MSIELHRTMSASEARVVLKEIHDHVCRYNGRVIITADDCESSDANSPPLGRCVLISEAELQGLEKAIEVLSGTADAAAMRAMVMRLASDTGETPSVPAITAT